MWRLLALALISGSLVSAQSPLARTEIGQPRTTQEEYALPNRITVDLYQVTLEPHFDTNTFTGSTSVTFTALEETNTIIIHTWDLTIDEASITISGDNSVLSTSYSNNDKQFYTITFTNNLQADTSYTLTFGSFAGTLHADNDGFYLAVYTDENGNERKLATTQFEPTSARRAFPCFDEPALKAQFDISMIRASDYNSISNSPLVTTTDLGDGRFKDDFERTVRMSTYLVAFIVSDFKYVAAANQRVFLRPVLISQNRGDYALQGGIDVLNAIAAFVNVPFTMPKMDQVGLPDGYFSAGAMENWGLVTYREAYLQYVEGVTAASSRESILTIIAHEFGHQWFGNLVSPLWWTYLWLNEGFATYFEYYGASVVEDDMDLMNQIVIKTVQYALGRDATTSTRPMNKDAGSPRDINSLFDTVAYDKSGSVIRMMEGVMTTPVFRTALNYYLQKMEFSAAQPTDLYASWQQAIDEANIDVLPQGESVASVMATWDSNAGYPLLRVTRNYESGTVTFSQRRYLQANPDNDDETIWYIPISYATATNDDFNTTTPKLWLTTRSEELTLSDLNSDDWLLVNLQQSGYYRVAYDAENWDRISSFLNTERFSEVTKASRSQLIEDSFHFARYGVIDYSIPLELARYIVRETDYIPLYPYINALNFLDTYISNTAAYSAYQSYILNLLTAAYTSVGLDESTFDRHVTKLNRINVLNLVCKYGDITCREGALLRLRQWKDDANAQIAANLQTPLVCSALRIGEQADWDFAFNAYKAATESVMRSRILAGLGCSENNEILNGFIEIIKDTSSGLYSSDRLTAWSSIYNSGTFGANYAYNYFKANFAALSSSFTTSQLSSIISGIAAKFSTQEQLDDLQEFASSVENTNIFNGAINNIRSNISWGNQYLSSILTWFDGVV